MRRAHLARRVAAAAMVAALFSFGPVPTLLAATPTPGTWAATGSLTHARGFAPAVLLNDGSVITAGGTDGFSFTATAERWSAGTWSAAGSIGQAAAGQVAALLPDGKALFAGGADDIGYYMNGDVFDPAHTTWTQTGPMTHAHAYGAAATLKSGDVMVIGGYDGGDTFTTGAVDIYSASAGTWSAGPALPQGRYAFTASTMTNGKVLVAGGDDGSMAAGSALSSVQIYTPGSGWAAAESMKKVRVDHAAVALQDGRVLVAGGVDANGTTLNTAEVYDPATGHWTTTATMSAARAGFTMTVLADGRVIAAGGYGTDPSQALGSTDLFDPTTGAWSPLGALVTGRRFQAATRLADGSVLVVGGHGSGTDYLSSAEIFTPPPAKIHYPATSFHPLDPARILDSRVGLGLSGPLYPGAPKRFQVAGMGKVPLTGAIAVTGILTTTASTAAGYLSLGPVYTGAPTFSSLNFPKGDNRANNVAVALDTLGKLSIVFVGAGRTHAIFDVTGYFTADNSGDTFKTMNPLRVLDTRDGTGGDTIFQANKPQSFHVTGVGGAAGVPAGALAVTGNLTVVKPSAAGWAYVGPPASIPADPSKMERSMINSPANDIRADGVTVKLDGSGMLGAVWSGAAGSTANLLFDVTGYFVSGSGGAMFVPLEPTRLIDTRVNLPFTGPVARATPVTITITGHAGVPIGATGISGNLTVTLQKAGGLMTVAPHLDPVVQPLFSTINFPKGDNRANGFDVSLLQPAGTLAFVYESTAAGATTHFVVDVTGYFVLAG
jgi:hypothetical protein